MKRSVGSGGQNGEKGRSADHPILHNKVHVLVVDDEKMIRSLLKMSLQRMGYEVTTADDGAEALELFQSHAFDLVLLDILMPNVDGFTVCSEVRRVSDVPVVMLTALNRPDDIVRGLELGADNYITKPFTFKEVEARIRAILRRTTNKIEVEPVQVLEYGDVRLDGGMRAATVAGNLVELTRTEYQLLHYLMTNVDLPVSKEDLLERVWGYEAADTNSNIVELAIRRLRKKLEEDASQPSRLITVRGIGYKFTPKGTPARIMSVAPAVQHRRPLISGRTPSNVEYSVRSEGEVIKRE
jgi:two-component system, OmpR family, response regulator RpaB